MSYQAYYNLKSPNEVLQKIATYVSGLGYNVVANCVDDLNIYDMSSVDGKKLVFVSRNNTYYYILRTANGINIFGDSDATIQDVEPMKTGNYYGIGITVSEGYSPATRWYNQFRVPYKYGGTFVMGSFMPMIKPEENTTFTLYCNNIYGNGNVQGEIYDTLVFSVVKDKDSYMQCSHMIMGLVNKYEPWTGGAFFSASAYYEDAATSTKCFEHEKDADKEILPVLASCDKSNTFLRMNIDGAVNDDRGHIYWASSGNDNPTGKKLSLPIRENNSNNGRIPNYKCLQSTSMYDWGRNVNTLNCLSINFPLYMSVLRDPDVMSLYSAVGQVEGAYYVSTLNMQTSHVYRVNYPSSGDICQVFPMGKRRGQYGYDGISIKQ